MKKKYLLLPLLSLSLSTAFAQESKQNINLQKCLRKLFSAEEMKFAFNPSESVKSCW